MKLDATGKRFRGTEYRKGGDLAKRRHEASYPLVSHSVDEGARNFVLKGSKLPFTQSQLEGTVRGVNCLCIRPKRQNIELPALGWSKKRYH